MRSKLFVPATRPEFFLKALNGEADAISFDLEDSVVADRKEHARNDLVDFLLRHPVRDFGKKIIVRINGLDSPYFQKDLEALSHAPIDMLNVPKIESRQSVQDLMAALDAARFVSPEMGVLANIETAAAVRQAHQIVDADRRICGLQLGLADLFEPLGISRYDMQNVRFIMLTLRLAMGDGTAFALDSAYANVVDKDGFRSEALLARSLGFLGKSCIHPSQVAIANEVFRPTESEIEDALKIIEASQANADTGAFLLDGKMIDAPFIQRAHDIVRIASGRKS